MTNAVLILILVAGPVAAFAVVLTLPRWFSRSLHGHRMWRLRDTVVDDVLTGKLPQDHEAVSHLIQVMDMVLHEKRTTLLDAYIASRVSSDVDPTFLKAAQSQGFACPLDGLSAGERALVEDYRRRFTTLLVGSMFLGSWFGIAHVIPFLPSGMRIAMRQASAATRDGIKHRLDDIGSRFEREITASAREATDLAATHSRLTETAIGLATRQDSSRPLRHTITL